MPMAAHPAVLLQSCLQLLDLQIDRNGQRRDLPCTFGLRSTCSLEYPRLDDEISVATSSPSETLVSSYGLLLKQYTAMPGC